MMMNISGTPPISYIDRPGEQPVQLRVNQRITAEILKVSGDQVSLAIQGARVVGRLETVEEAIALLERRTAQFVVRGMVDGVLQLQVVPAKEGETTPPTQASQWTVLAQNLLKLNNLPLNDANMNVARALLGRGLPVTGELVNELLQSLNGMSKWGQAEADLAAAFKANGLPLSTGTLSLAMQKLPSLSETIQQLQVGMAKWLQSGVPAELRPLAEKVFTLLQGSLVDWDADPAAMMNRLPQVVAFLGKSLESELAGLLSKDINSGIKPGDSTGLLALASFRGELAARGENNLVGQIDRFMDSLRQVQFLNSTQVRDPNNPPWLVTNLPLLAGSLPNVNPPHRDIYPSNLRVAYRVEGDGKKIDPQNTRLVLTIDLEEGDYLQVDLSMIGKRIGAWMTVSTQEWRQLIESELPSLQTGLEKLGYNLQFSRCEVRPLAPGINMAEDASAWPATKINLEA